MVMAQENEKKISDEGEGYTAIVYFHGMGEQRRHEELSCLIDAFDNYSFWANRNDDRNRGILTGIKPRLEVSDDFDRDVSYIRVNYKFKETVNDKPVWKSFRFYESYWAPITAKGKKNGIVISWMFRQVLTPIKTILSVWRDRQRLRRSALHSLWEEQRREDYKEGNTPEDFVALAEHYNIFERKDVRRKFKDGKFQEFIEYIKQECNDEDETNERLKALAYKWRRRYLRQESRNVFVLFTLAIAIILGLAGLLIGLLALFSYFTEAFPVLDDSMPWSFSSVMAMGAAYGKNHVGSVAIMLLMLFGAKRFLQGYMSDVLFWTTYKETDENHQKRRAILDYGSKMLRHVLNDDDCKRVVVIAHSLGTAVAMDSLLELGRFNRARNAPAPMKGPLPLEKLDQFITLGSPIDKIQYFFESFTAKCHRFIRVVDDVRGDIGTVPFTKNRKQHIHWVNYWDRADIVSGPLHSTSNRQWSYPRVDNVEVKSYRFPAPGKSHSGYFKHKKVIGDIFDMLFHNTHSFRNGAIKELNSTEEKGLFIGPGIVSKNALFFHVIALSVPWLFVVGLIVHPTNQYWSVVGVIVFVLIVLGIFVNAVNGHLDSFMKGHD